MKITKRHCLWFLLGWLLVWVWYQFFSWLEERQLEIQDQDSSPLSGWWVKLVVLSWWELIQVQTQVSGKLSRIFKSPWDLVLGGEPILQFADTVAEYGLQARYAKNQLDAALLIRKNLYARQPSLQGLSGWMLVQQLSQLEEQVLQLLERGFDLNSPELTNYREAIVETEQKLQSEYIAQETQVNEFTQQLLDINNQIAHAKNDYEEALMHTAQLTIRAPISGFLAEIPLQKGQEVTSDRLAFVLMRPLETIEFLIAVHEIVEREMDQIVDIKIKEKNLTWSIVAILPSDQKDRFIVKVMLSESLYPSWDIAQIFPQRKK